MIRLTRAEFLRFAAMERSEQEKLIAAMSPADLLAFDAQFEFWAHEGQLQPQADGWRTWLMLAGRGFGKTRAGAEWIFEPALRRQVRVALVAATIAEARAVMVEGPSGLLRIAANRRKLLRWEPSKGEIRWPGGSLATLFSGDNGDGLRGPEHDFAW